MPTKVFNSRKKIAKITIPILFLITTSCIKQNQDLSNHNRAQADSVCINRLYPIATDYRVSGSVLDSILVLFQANNLPIANLLFLSLSTDSTTNINPLAYSGYQEQVLATQFINGLPLFGSPTFFTFNAGIYQPAGNIDGYYGPAPDSDITGHQTMATLRDDFLAKVSESFISGGPLNAKPFVPSASTYEGACLDVTLGYIDASMIPGNSTAFGMALVKVWSVTATASSSITYYPLVYVEDDNGQSWGVPIILP
jgi:hypothetical protein